MEVLQSGDDLRRVELGRAGYELAGLSEVTEELPATDVGEQHVETVRVLVAPHQRDNEGVAHLSGGKIIRSELFYYFYFININIVTLIFLSR